MMRYRFLLTGSVAFLALMALFPSAAQAQYHEYTSGKPSVEVDLGALGDLPADTAADNATYKTAPAVAPVLQMPLGAPEQTTLTTPSPRILKPPVLPAKVEGSLTADEEKVDFPPPVVEKQPTQKSVSEAVVAEPVRKPAMKAEPVAVPSPEFSSMVAKTAQDEKKTTKIKPQEAPKKQETPPAEKPAAPGDAHDDIAWEAPAVAPQDETASMELETEAAPSPDLAAVPSLADLTLTFDGNSTDLSPGLQQKLDDLASHLKDDIASRLQVRAFATGEDGTKGSARRIALARALTVRSYLMDKGIKPARVDVRALGSETDRAPLDRVDLVFMAP